MDRLNAPARRCRRRRAGRRPGELQGRQALADRRPGQPDRPGRRASYAIFLARGLEAAVNRQIISAGRDARARATRSARAPARPPRSRRTSSPPRPRRRSRTSPSPSPTVVQYFAPAVLALILQHLAVTLIALSVVRERNSGLFELFRISPITTAELVTGKLVAYGLFAGAVAFATIGPPRRRLPRPDPRPAGLDRPRRRRS